MKICSKCILDENYPGISFDDDGVVLELKRHSAKDIARQLTSHVPRPTSAPVPARALRLGAGRPPEDRSPLP